MQHRGVILFAGLFTVTALAGIPRLPVADCLDEPGGMDDRDVLELGYRVAAVREAIQNPAAPHALQAITDLGHDQRYYVMVRGWLAYQRQGDMSIVAASSGQAPQHIQERIRFLDRAIRAIDLD